MPTGAIRNPPTLRNSRKNVITEGSQAPPQYSLFEKRKIIKRGTGNASIKDY